MKRLAAILALVVAAGCSATAHPATPTGLSILRQKATYGVYRKSSVSQLEAREKAACELIASSSDLQSGITAAGVKEIRAGASGVDARLFVVAATSDSCPQYFNAVRSLLLPAATTAPASSTSTASTG